MSKIKFCLPLISLLACGPQAGSEYIDNPVDATVDSSVQETSVPDTAPESSDANNKNIFYHNGPVMTGTVNTYVIWYGDFGGDSTQDIVNDFLNNLGQSSWYKINTTYYQINPVIIPEQPDASTDSSSAMFSGDKTYVSGNLKLVKSTTDAYSMSSVIYGDDKLRLIITNALDRGDLPLDENGVYLVLTSPEVHEWFAPFYGFCMGYCGYHWFTWYHDVPIKYAFIGDPQYCPRQCAPEVNQLQSPNGNTGADAMTSIIAHEISEMVTDPLGNAWYDSMLSNEEDGDLCSWQFSPTYKVKNGSQANMKLGTRDYLIQQLYVNVPDNGYCALEVK